MDPIPNVTVTVGHDAAIPCTVENLGFYRVAWLRVESKTILTIHHNVITRNYRVNLSYTDHKKWILHIKNAQESDRGLYMCQINTVPMKSQIGYLDVVEKTYEGMDLTITKVSRLHMGAYLCVASNGVQPSISKRILLQVHFPPMIWIPNQLVGSPIGGSVKMDCHTEAYPASINYWTKQEGEMIVDSKKYTVQKEEETYKVHMILIINTIESEDFGAFRCFAKNSLGSTQGLIRLYEIHLPPSQHASTARIQSVGGVEEQSKKQADRKLDINTQETARRMQGVKFNSPNVSETREQGSFAGSPGQNFPDKQSSSPRPKLDFTCYFVYGFALCFMIKRLLFLPTKR
ncbi:lachesin-like isoform X3 [Tachypleus tridentatus]|uniref:lachesin-like isoform X3 n=1 Tax=Tachypleus tridentatus TaxID=6853 RepID=UPI003FD51C3D